MFRSLYSRVCFTQNSDEELVDPGEYPDDVEGGERDVEEEAHPHVDALLRALVPEIQTRLFRLSPEGIKNENLRIIRFTSSSRDRTLIKKERV